jgi:Zn-dependent M28 family amino/carboxypeptidase
VTEQALTDSELVFVGYGIVEPQQAWNDYAGIDMRGKTAVVLVNDPGFVTGDPALFKGRAMTYHGRWTYKFEEASRQGAAAVLIVHEDAPAAYPWAVVRNGAAKPQLILDRPEDTSYRIGIEGWVTLDSARRLFAAAGQDYESLKAQAARRGFKPVPLGLRASTSVRNLKRSAVSSNVVGVLPGSKRPGEYVLYTAHWDHLGRALAFAGDAIFNGAVDNATGTAMLMELARAYGAAGSAPERSVVFVAFTGEEFGLLGSEYFAANPPYPLARVAGGINIDAPAPKGRTRDVTVTGLGASELEEYLRVAAAEQRRVLVPESLPENGYYYRSDHFPLAKRGVPMLYFEGGIDLLDGGTEAGLAWDRDYVSNRYHKPGDEYDPSWRVDGLLEDLRLYYVVGRRIADDAGFPQWLPGNEFRPIREQSLREAASGSAQANQAP